MENCHEDRERGKLPFSPNKGMAMAKKENGKRGKYYELSEDVLNILEGIKETTGNPANRTIDRAVRELAKNRPLFRRIPFDDWVDGEPLNKTEQDDRPPSPKKNKAS
jgi:hypothetical protein